MKEKRCRICGELFVPKSSRQLDCGKLIIRTCTVCGSQFEAKCSKNDTRQACSTECTNKLSAINRYASVIKYCEICGEPFQPKSNTQRFCKSIHEIPCKICGKLFTTDLSIVEHAVTCSKECMLKLRFQNGNPFQDPEKRKAALMKYKERTGYDHPMQNPEVVAKMQATMLERYDDTSFTRTAEYIEKTIDTNVKKYGAAWPMQNPEIQKKQQATLFEHYHVLNPFQSQEIIEQYKKSYLQKTGYAHPANNPEVVAKRRKTNLSVYNVEEAIASDIVRFKSKQTIQKRFNVDNAMQSPEVQAKSAETCMQRYGATTYLGSEVGKQHAHERFKAKFGVDKYSQLKAWKQNQISDPAKVDEWLRFLDDPKTYLTSFSHVPAYHELEEALGVNSTTISYWVNVLGLQDYIKFTLSTGEDDIVSILKQINPTIEIKRHDRTILHNKELDIVLPKYNVAIEFNPTVTHNSSLRDPWGSEPKYPRYHYDKSVECKDKGIFLFHIFGYEWTHRQNIIISMLKNLIHDSSHTIYARKCKVQEVSSSDARKFLQINHRQGAAGASIRLGLYYENELVSLMTFGKMRNTIGTDDSDLSNCYELVRFCSQLDTSVVGGASKLFKYFIKHYSPTQIRSFSDRAHTKGTLYETLGFREIRRSDPNYVWVDTMTDIAYHRINAQKRNLKRFLHDDTIDLNKTEVQIMVEHGFVQVFDSGTITWEWASRS